MKICVFADALYYSSGGHVWEYLNWALGLRSLGCEVTWMEAVLPNLRECELNTRVAELRSRLEPYGLAANLALTAWHGESLGPDLLGSCCGLDAAAEADLLLSMRYDASAQVVRRFRRSALIDIDPGLLQIWMSEKQIEVARHDVYFTTGETVGRPGSLCPDVGLEWHYAPPCVALNYWSVHPAGHDAPFTTVSHWCGDEWVEHAGETYQNDKRTGFLPYFGLPQCTSQPLELALCLASDEDEDLQQLQQLGWRVAPSQAVVATPGAYQRYIQNSRGEFSCAKPSCIRLQNAWISNRTLCYLASGKPAVVQHTGPSRFLPDAEGLFRFRDPHEAVKYLELAASDYAGHCRRARKLAEEHDAAKVTRSVLERAL
jgi:hypothetical protein